jgi:hypothetical protein
MGRGIKRRMGKEGEKERGRRKKQYICTVNQGFFTTYKYTS